MKVFIVAVICILLSTSLALTAKRNSEPLLLSTFDFDHNGVLDRRELRIITRILSAIFLRPKPAVRHMIQEADVNKDGHLSEDEFDALVDSNFEK